MRTSSIFKSRWVALLWAAGIIWFAYDFADSTAQPSNATDNAEQPTDASGAAVTTDDQKHVEEALRNL